VLRPTTFPVAGGAQYTNDWGGARSRDATGGTGGHQGTDLFAAAGTPVVAVEDGVISKMGPSKIGGNRIWLNKRFYYAHLQAFAKGLKVGSQVRAGQVIGYVGTTGDAKGTPPHLHFGYSPNSDQGGSYANPYDMLKSWQTRRLDPDVVLPTPDSSTVAGGGATTIEPAQLELGGGLAGPPVPGAPVPPLPGTGEIPYREPNVTGDLWRLVAPESQEGRRFLELSGGTDAG
jgi:murein DD-endopeptidase MepM/ murein hydrolase activator NlpD